MAAQRTAYEAWMSDYHHIAVSGLNRTDLASCAGSAHAFRAARGRYRAKPPSVMRTTYEQLLDAQEAGLQLCEDHNLAGEQANLARVSSIEAQLKRESAPIAHKLKERLP